FTTSGNQNGELNAGDTVNVTVTFSTPVSLSGGSAVLHLSNNVDLTKGAVINGNQVQFTYTVAPGHDIGDLQISSLSPANGVTLEDPAGNNASLAFNATDVALGVDTTAPTVSTVAFTHSGDRNGELNAGDTVIVTVSLSEPVSLSGGNAVLHLSNGV